MTSALYNEMAETLDRMYGSVPVSNPDVPRLRKYTEWVEEQATLPEYKRQWNQEFFALTEDMLTRQDVWWFGATALEVLQAATHECGSVCCVAGKVAMDDGWAPLPGNQVVRDGVVRHPFHVAKEALGLNERQATELFAASNTAEDVRRVAEWIAGERL